MKNIILHVDMDAFFASVEQKCNPSLRGKAIGVVGAGKRTVVTTSSYEARARGVKTGMNKYEAKSICPEIIFVTGDNRKYTDTSIRIMNILKDFTPDVEVYSVDEAFMDITGTEKLFGSPMEVGRKIKGRIKTEIGINASVGIGDNKLTAKIASGYRKPDGLFMLDETNKDEILKDMKVGDIWGIGNKLEKHLNDLGVYTCSELAAFPASVLRQRFGIVGERLKLMGAGLYNDSVSAEKKGAVDLPKSIGHSATLSFDIDSKDMDALNKEILKLTAKVCSRARKYNLAGRKVSLYVRYKDFTGEGKQKLMNIYTNDTKKVYHHAALLLKEVKPSKPVRLLGVTLSGIAEDLCSDLFETEAKSKKLMAVMDKVNSSFGNESISFGETFLKEEESGVISPAWRPNGVRKIDVK